MVRSVRGRDRFPAAALCLAVLLTACQLGAPGPALEPPEPAEPMHDAPQDAPTAEPPGDESAGKSPPVVPHDREPALTTADTSAGEADGMLRFTVTISLPPDGPVTVSYATADGTATAGQDYTATDGKLTFPADSDAAQPVQVPITDDDVHEGDETFSLRLSDPLGAALVVSAATATIVDDDPRPPPPKLASLAVTNQGRIPNGATAMYPPFAADTYHYALTCTNDTTLAVTARSARSSTRLTLLRADRADNEVATASLDVQVPVDKDHDIVVELSDTGGTRTYVVHCLPADFPRVTVLHKSEQAAGGLLFVTARYLRDGDHTNYIAIIDYNGVPRYQVGYGSQYAFNFQPHADGPLVGGKRVRSSVYGPSNKIALFDRDLNRIGTAAVVSPLSTTDFHDFRITEDGTFLLISYHWATRDFSAYERSPGVYYSSTEAVQDSVIQEVDTAKSELFRWNSWDHREDMQLGNDCRVGLFIGDYAHLNSLQKVDGDIVASFPGCAQVLRIDGTTGAVQWKLGGTAPPADSDAVYLPIVDDAAGEFCWQHHVTLTDRRTVVLFDNGTSCVGARKDVEPFTRVVEYDISSGSQAVFLRDFRRPEGHGHTRYQGGVAVFKDAADSDRWMIAWGPSEDRSVSVDQLAAVSEVDPATGTAHFHMNLWRGGAAVEAHRVYREPEADVTIPLNLP